jgi:SAM-dependent methyltransferase
MTSGSTAARSGAGINSVAPLAPNAWLRYDLVKRMLPAGITDVLEVGCGRGAVGARLAQRYQYLGVEPDQASCAVAQQRVTAAGAGQVRNVSVEELGDERFDLVCAFEVLEHIQDDAMALKEWASRLRAGGWLLISIPADQHRYGPHDERVGHFRRYDPPALAALLADCGFGEIEVRRYGFPLCYFLEFARNLVGRRGLAAAPDQSIEDRTAGSGRLMQPSSATLGAVIQWGTAPFRLLQRAFPQAGTGLVARARLMSRG